MHRAFSSLTFKLSVGIVAVQLAITTLVGFYYLNHFTSEADQRIKKQIQVPGILMNKGLLNYDAISNRDTMKQILGDDLEEAMIFAFDHTIYQSINAKDLGRTTDQLDRIDLQDFNGAAKEVVFNGQDAEGKYIASITPIYSAAGQAPFLFAYIKIKTQNLEQEKNVLAVLILVSSLLTVLFTSTTIFLLLRLVMLGNIKRLRKAAEMVSQGQLGPEVAAELPHTKDELGQLSEAFQTMVDRLQATYRDLAEKQARLRASVNSLALGFIMADTSHNIITINPAALEQFHKYIDAAKPSLQQLEAELDSKSINLSKTIDECLATGRPQEFKEVVLHDRFLHILLAPIALDESNPNSKLGVVMLFEDVTEERIHQRSKDEFFSIASHELRTPLTAIRGNAAMIQQYYPEQIKNSGIGEMVGDIHESSVRLIEIVNDFLDASRLEQSKMQFRPEAFSLEEVIEKVVYELAAVIREKGIYMKMSNKLDTLPLVYADKNRVKQIVYNLTGNAVKFVERGGVEIKASVEGKFIKVLIIDTGKGITPENQQILFHKFQQATTSIITRDSTRGTGLGLYISKLLIEHMNGKIALESSVVGKGSTFSFTLPIAPPKYQKPAPKK